jgi:hypothetical protein
MARWHAWPRPSTASPERGTARHDSARPPPAAAGSRRGPYRPGRPRPDRQVAGAARRCRTRRPLGAVKQHDRPGGGSNPGRNRRRPHRPGRRRVAVRPAPTPGRGPAPRPGRCRAPACCSAPSSSAAGRTRHPAANPRAMLALAGPGASAASPWPPACYSGWLLGREPARPRHAARRRHAGPCRLADTGSSPAVATELPAICWRPRRIDRPAASAPILLRGDQFLGRFCSSRGP